MFAGNDCRLLSATEDQFINRRMGTMSIDEHVSTWRMDAATPEQLDALAFQVLCCARRCSTKEHGRPWKDAWRTLTQDAANTRARLARHPSPQTHPGFFSKRSVGRPGHLDADLHLPLAFSLDLSGMPVREVYSGSYQPTLREDVIYRVSASRDGYTWLTHSLPTPIKVPTRTLRGLLSLGRMVAMPLSAVAKAA